MNSIHRPTGMSLTALVCALALGLWPALNAQEAFDEEEDEDMEGIYMIGGGQLHDLQNAQDVASGVSVFIEDNLEDLYLSQDRQLSGFVPGSFYSAGESGLSIRGLGGLGRHPGSTSAVPLFEDHTVYKSSVLLPLNAGSFLSERVEVLRGTQDALYGNAATGGVVDRISRKPRLDGEPEYHARISGGRFGRQDLGITFAGAFTDVFGYRLTALEANQDGMIENFADEVPNLGSIGTKYQEAQLQLGSGETTRMWFRTYNLNQQSLPMPTIQLSAYGSVLEQSGNPYDGQPDNPALVDHRADFLLSETEENLAEALTRGVTSSSFYSTLDPKTLNNLDYPYRVRHNFAGSESLDDTRGTIFHWDIDLGSYARISMLGAYHRVEYSSWEDADRVANTAVDLRKSTDVNSTYYSREFRFGTQGKRTLSWMFGGYFYDEETERRVRSVDAAFVPVGDSTVVTSSGVSQTQDLGFNLSHPGTLSDYYAEVEIDGEDTFSYLALDFGGFKLSVASRTAESVHLGADADLIGYAGSSNGWARHFELQWNYLQQTLGNGIDVADFESAMETALGVTDFTYDPSTSFYGTEDIATYIAELLALAEALPAEDRAEGTAAHTAIALKNAAGVATDLYSSGTPHVLFQTGYIGPAIDLMETNTIGSCRVDDRDGRCTKETYEGDSTRGTVEISLGDGHLLYFSSLEGYRPGGSLATSYNGLSDPVYKEEMIEGSEYGLKLGWRRFKLNISAFDYDYTDMQTVAEHLRTDGTLYQAPFNIAKATASGVEVDFSWKVAEWLRLHLYSGSLDTEVTEGVWVEPALLGGATIDLKEKMLPNAPESQWGANLQIHLSETVFWSVSRRQRADTYFSVFNSPYAFMAEHEIVDARLVIRSRDDRMRLTLYGENLEDEVSWNYAVEGKGYQPALSAGTAGTSRIRVNGGLTNSFTAVVPNPPRTLGVQVDFRF